MDGRPTWTDCDEAGDYVVPNVLSPRDLVFRPDNMDETVPHTDVQILYAKTGKCVIIKYFTPYKVRLTVYALIHERHHDKMCAPVKTSRKIILYTRPVLIWVFNGFTV